MEKYKRKFSKPTDEQIIEFTRKIEMKAAEGVPIETSLMLVQAYAIAEDNMLQRQLIERAIKDAEDCLDIMNDEEGSMVYSGMWEEILKILKGEI